MVSEKGSFVGNLSEICRWFSLSTETRNRNKIKRSITFLSKNKFIKYSRNGNTYTINIVPKENAIEIPDFTLEKIKTADCSGTSIDWINLLKLYLLIEHHSSIKATYNDISKILNVGETTLANAKKILDKNFHELSIDKIKKKQPDGSYWVVGQEFTMGAAFTKTIKQ